MSNKKIAVIGLGNTLRRDDGIGIVILESLLAFHKTSGIDYLNFGIAGFDLLHRIRDYDTVVLIDGINASLPIGELRIFELDKIEYDLKDTVTSSHELGLKDIFELYKKLDIKTKVYVAGIQVEDVSFGEGLTDTLKARCNDITKEISEFLDVLCHTGKSR
ncbi:MAG: hydrogenase maturation protease [Candidatus Omnitrophota bacterium]|nr:hydrogenase maturation protease [Candidatus Omnitrophota bacterium]